MEMTGAQAILHAMEIAGISQVFGYPGGCIMPLYDALPDSSIQHYLCRHEQGCALAADGYARASGEIGVAIATSGPGATNLITGVANAAMDSIPMLVITGQVPSDLIGTDAFQEIDVLGLTFGLTKHSYLVTNAEDIPRIMTQAIALAKEGRPGPVWIDISKDAMLNRIEFPICPVEDVRLNLPVPSPRSLERAVQLIMQSKRPLIYSGGGVSIAGALTEYRLFRKITGIPSVETLNGLGNAGLSSAGNLGLVGMHGSRAANTAVDECDLLIALGARFDDRATGELTSFAANALIIQLDIDPSEHNKLKTVDMFLLGNLSESLSMLAIKMPDTLPILKWQERCLHLHLELGFKAKTSHGSINGPDVLDRLDRCSTGAIVSCDVGQHQMWVAQQLEFERPQNHLSSGGLGAMGYGLPAAIGAQVRFGDKAVICVCGDGSFMMNIQELATVKRYALPVKIIVLDNAHLGLVRQQQNLFYQQRYSESDLDDNPSFAELAQAFGIASREIIEATKLDDSLDWLMAQSGPALLHIHIERESRVWPMVPPGSPNTQMLEGTSNAQINM